jgi:hypothetical protein
MRHRIIVQVEPDIGPLADLDGHPLHHRVRIVPLPQQSRRFLGEDLANAASLVFRAAPLGSHAAAPGVGMGVEIVQIGECTGGEERVPDEPSGFFHATFFIATRDGDGTRFKPVIRGEVEQRRVEADCVALPLQHGTAQIVVQYDSWDPLPRGERAEMTAQEVLHVGVEEEAQKDLPREAEYHDESHQGAARATDH